MGVHRGARAAAALGSMLVASGFGSTPDYLHPQYLMMNKAVFNTGALAWNQNDVSTCTQASIDEILNIVKTRGTASRKLGFAFPIMLLGSAQEQTEYLAFMDCILALSLNNNLPVALALDPFEFWDARPDLWNWFNDTAPGYNTANIDNVEWTCWDPSCATKLAWRDWGSQFRVPPHPNLASPIVMENYLQVVRPAAKKLADWYAALPADKQWLLAYVKVSWEANIGLNYYFYEDGNKYYGQDPKLDPTDGVNKGLVVQQGYNAICTLGMACKGNVSVAHLDAVVSEFLQTMGEAIADTGIPRSKLVVHQGASFDAIPTNNSEWSSTAGAITTIAGPGYSFYTYAYNPSDAPTLEGALMAVENTPWAASEWLYIQGNSGSTQEQWLAAFNNTLGYLNNRMIALYNWETIRDNADVLAAIQTFLNSPVECLVESAFNFTWTSISDGQVQVAWQRLEGEGSDKRYIDISSVGYLKPSGALAVPTVVNHADVTGQDYFVFSPLGPGNYYVSVVSTGCESSATGLQAVPSDVFLVEVSPQ